MGDRERTGVNAGPAGVGGTNARARGPIGVTQAAPAAPPSGVHRFVGEDGSIRRAGRTTAQELQHLRDDLTERLDRLNPVERVKAEAQNDILRYLHIPSDQFAEAQEIVGMTRAALGGSALAAASVLVNMFMAGVEAMQAGQRQRDCLCSAYTFGYWVFSNRGMSAPSQPPADLHRRNLEEDRRGNYDRVSASRLAERWRDCHRETLHRLDRSVSVGVMRNELHRVMRGANEAVANARAPQVRNWFKVTVLAREFGNDPRIAASVFFLETIKNLSDVERQVATILYRRHPYTPDV